MQADTDGIVFGSFFLPLCRQASSSSHLSEEQNSVVGTGDVGLEEMEAAVCTCAGLEPCPPHYVISQTCLGWGNY